MTAPLPATKQYASAQPFLSGTADANLAGSGEDSVRLQVYDLYDGFYHNRPETFTVTLMGEDNDRKILMPIGKKIIEAILRFLAVDYNYVVVPGQSRGTDEEKATIDRMVENFFKREEVQLKVANNKRYGLIRGDACFHITADPTKEEGSRLSLHELHPGNFFPIWDPQNEKRMIGCHIVDVVQDPREPGDPTKRVTRRLTYLREGVVRSATPGYEIPEGQPLGGVTSETTLWTIGKWDDRNMAQDDLEQVNVSSPLIIPLISLPPQITSLPIYHWKNGSLGGTYPFGISAIAGLETVLNGIHQGVSDEDFALVMAGLGMFWTNSKPPRDEAGNTLPWEIGPGVVAEVGADGQFNRVQGVNSVAPYQDHLKYLEDGGLSTNGVPEVAAGRVDVQVAESGISLRLQFAPILAANAEREKEILGEMDHLLYDLTHMWFPAYEEYDAPEVVVASVVGNPLPENREAAIQEILLLFSSGLITIEMAQARLAKYGYDFKDGDNVQVIRDAQAMAQARAGDEVANRYAQELENQPEGTIPTPQATPAPATVGTPSGTGISA